MAVSTAGSPLYLPQVVAFQCQRSPDIYLCPLKHLHEVSSLQPYRVEDKGGQVYVPPYTHSLTKIQFSSNGKFLLVDSCFPNANNVCIIEVKKALDQCNLIRMAGHTTHVLGASFSLDNMFVISWSISNDGELIKWNIVDQQQMVFRNDLNAQDVDINIISGINALSFVPNSHTIVTSTNKGTIHLRDGETLTINSYIKNQSTFSPTNMSMAMSGRHVITTGHDGWLRVWAVRDLSSVAKYYIGGQVHGLAVIKGENGGTLMSCGDVSGRNTILSINL